MSKYYIIYILMQYNIYQKRYIMPQESNYTRFGDLKLLRSHSHCTDYPSLQALRTYSNQGFSQP